MGDWNLIVEDTLFGDSGLLSDLNISGDIDMGPMSVSEPGMLVLLGLGLAGLGFARRKA